MCENCQWGVSFIGKTVSKQCIYNRNMRNKELQGVSLVVLHSAESRRLVLLLLAKATTQCASDC